VVEVLYFEGCPNYESLLPHLRQLLERAEVDCEIKLRCVESLEEAQRERFLGSPTVRVDGRDVEPDAEQRSDFGRKCRLYRNGSRLQGVPPDEWVLGRIQESRSLRTHPDPRLG
jgi:hypothetical protein